MATKIQIRRDSAVNWTSVGPTLSEGEFGLTSATAAAAVPVLKVGDGASIYSALPYAVMADTSHATELDAINEKTGAAGVTIDGLLVKDLTVSAATDITIDSTGAGVNINTHTDAGDDFAVNTTMLVVKGDTGNVGIGTASPGVALDVVGAIKTSLYLQALGGGYLGTVGNANSLISQATSGTTTTSHFIGTYTIDVTAPSDGTLKTIVGPTEKGLVDVLRWEMVDYKWNENSPMADKDSIRIGGIAQKIYKTNPELVIVGDDVNPWRIKYNEKVPYLVRAIQELAAKVEALEAA